MTKRTCKSCRWSFSAYDHKYNPVLMCWPKNAKHSEQLAIEVCQKYEREPGSEGDD